MRKSLLLIAVMLVLGLASSHASAANAATSIPESQTEQDKANIAVVKAFIAGWDQADRGSPHLADNASLRMEEGKPALIGKKAYTDAWAALLPGQKVVVKYHEIVARGPVVLTNRTDILVTPGKPDMNYEIVGYFIVKDKKIVEWADLHK